MTVGYGTQIKRGNGAGTAETFTEITGIVGDIAGPELTLGTAESTTHSTADAHRTFDPTLIDAGEVSFEILWDPDDAQHAGLETDLTSRLHRNFRMEWPDGYEVQFDAIVTKCGQSAPLDDEIKRAVTLKISGAVSEVP